MFRSILNRLKEEDGSITPIMVGIALGCICIVLMLGVFANIYIAKRQAQTAADAAVLAAQMKLEEKFNEALSRKAQEVVDDYLESVAGDQATIQSDIQISRLENALIDNSKIEILDVIREPHFREDFSQEKMSNLMYNTVEDNWKEIESAASSIALANGSEKDVYLKFPYEDKAKIYGVAKRKFKVPIFDDLMDEEDRYIGSQATVLFKSNNFSFPDFDFSSFFYFSIESD